VAREATHVSATVRRFPRMDSHSSSLRYRLIWLLLFGMAGIAVELVLLAHDETASMLVPFVAIAVAVSGAVARLARPSAASVLYLRATMALLLVAGVLGVYFHYRGGVAFQIDMDPTLSRWALFLKVLHMQAPPMLAPGVLVQLALLGLASTYKDPLRPDGLSDPLRPDGLSDQSRPDGLSDHLKHQTDHTHRTTSQHTQ
jgi:hypothetical protein